MSSHPKITENPYGNSRSTGHLRSTHRLDTWAQDGLDESAFRSVLLLECKRAERSGNLFALMLLDAAQFAEDGDDSKRVANLLIALTRETDVVGWREQGSVLGVIFTDIDFEKAETVLETLRTRVETGLERTLGSEASRQAIISIELFPERCDGPRRNAENSATSKFYPDGFRPTRARKTSLVIKRAIDIVGSASLLVMLSPLLAAIAAAIKLTSKGEVLFRQERLGHNGVPFQFLKFRSMYVNNSSDIHREFVTDFIKGKNVPEEQSQAGRVYKIAQDPRVTPVGRFLRKSSFDELPTTLECSQGANVPGWAAAAASV